MSKVRPLAGRFSGVGGKVGNMSSPGVKGIGIDMVDIARVDRAVNRWGERFTGRVFTEEELTYSRRHSRPAQHLSARFAGKEAVVKALGGLGGGGRMSEIEIVSGPMGRPLVRLHGSVRRLAAERGVSEIFLSLSHTGQTAVAQAVAVGGAEYEEVGNAVQRKQDT
jgi:holo-[acyl-carrier protein] synthase